MTLHTETMTSTEIRKRFLNFFKERGHAIIPSASLVPENDPSVLFNTAGMQPLVPYLLGETHPAGTRLADIQKCVRTGDIDEVGDNTHLTFFEMMGNWSLGDYFKKDAIQWSFDLLTNKEYGFGLDPKRLYVTCFEGNDDAPKDIESAEIWKHVFESHEVTGERIYFMPAKNNWWSAGDNGPCGPDTEMFYDMTGSLSKPEGLTKEEYLKADDEQKVVEIWNDVFMEYIKRDGSVAGKLAKQNVDTGSGFERVCAVLQGKTNVFETDLFAPLLGEIQKESKQYNERSARIFSDHIRTSFFLIADGVLPGNKDRGYILRRLLRRAVLQARNLALPTEFIQKTVLMFTAQYGETYPETNNPQIIVTMSEEVRKFRTTLDEGLKEFEKGTDPFILFTSYGFPFELTAELAKEKGISVDEKDFQEKFKAHQDLSRAGAEQKFKGGMGGTGEKEVQYHTTTHVLHQALRDVLGTHVQQKGSNITAERLRFDFTHSQKMTDDEKKKVEDIVNEKIQAHLPMNKVVMKKEDAEKTGALHFFGDKYGDEVSVYYIGETLESAYSKEFCGGPHIQNTSELGHFKISKEEAVSLGIRRIKAVLE